MEKNEINQDIAYIKDKAVNYALVSFSFLGILTIITVFFSSYKIGMTKPFDMSVQVFTMFVLVFSSSFRRYLSIDIKIIIMTIVLFLLCTVNFYGFGILSNLKIFIVVYPIFLSFVLSLKKAIIALFLLIIIYSLYGYLFSKGILVYSFDISVWATNRGVWLTGIVVILTASIGMLLVGHFFNEALKNNFIHQKWQNFELVKHRTNLECLVKERTEELERRNKELKCSYLIVNEKNEIINEQNLELKATLEHLKETQVRLLQSDKMASLGILTAGVAHEINNPLNFIMNGYIGLENYFNESGAYKNKNIQILLNSIQTGIERVSEIVKGLNQFSRNNETFAENCNIHSIINNCLVILNNQLKNRIEVQKDFTNETHEVSGNVGKLHQVFINILSNSIQAIDKNGIISIVTYKKGKAIFIELSDTGCGIAEENLVKIADPFFTTKDPGKGTGLGLSIAYNIIQDHRGTIDFQSELGKGTKVKISLPCF